MRFTKYLVVVGDECLRTATPNSSQCLWTETVEIAFASKQAPITLCFGCLRH